MLIGIPLTSRLYSHLRSRVEHMIVSYITGGAQDPLHVQRGVALGVCQMFSLLFFLESMCSLMFTCEEAALMSLVWCDMLESLSALA